MGNHIDSANLFYYNNSYNWTYPDNNSLWNLGTNSEPIKTEYDPCPDGWRVPTYYELEDLYRYYSFIDSIDDCNGYWFSGASSNNSNNHKLFLPASGYRYYYNGKCDRRGCRGYYWSSNHTSRSTASYFGFDGSIGPGTDPCASGLSVRCVQE